MMMLREDAATVRNNSCCMRSQCVLVESAERFVQQQEARVR